MLVFNHFAVPRGQPGGTRHVELFARLSGWDYLILAGDTNHLTGEFQSAEPGFRPVRVTPFCGNGLSRIVNWMSYAFSSFLRALRVGKVDVVYASSPHLLAALTGWLIATLKGVPFVLEVRDLWPRVLIGMGQLLEASMTFRMLTRLETFLYTRASRIVVLAEGSRTELESRGVPREKLIYIPNGADPVDFQPSAPRDQLRARYGFSTLTAVYAGAHGPANGLSLLLDAAQALSGIDLEIVLAGGGITKERLVVDARSRGLQNVRFMDPVPKSEMPDLLNAADVGLHVLADVPLFRAAVSPNKLFDYMASGLPVVTNCPGLVSELVVEAGCGFTVAPRDLDSGLRACSDADGPAALPSMGAAGRRWIAAHQSRSAMALRLQSVLDDVINGVPNRIFMVRHEEE